ncbi:MAG: hypothetical protein NTW28_18260 [Candidatus Solibacter sp.]|nr:hypothetical protein [Candidatus Solibacter sp.]
MKPHEAIGILMGCVCLVCALVPGTFRGLMDGIQGFRDEIDSVVTGMPVRRQPRAERESPQSTVWLAVVGGMWIALSVYSYFST